MTHFNSTTNIEKRMPTTGEVFCIDRMTSDYAEQHPFDVDGFIESVYQEFAGTEFEESRETLKKLWMDVLSDTNPRGDASLYPNKNGAKRAAAMKVWHKVGDYWRRGLRNDDTLPDMVPMTKIIRLDDGSWIALFPKDRHLLDTTTLPLPLDGMGVDTADTDEQNPSTPELFREETTTDSLDDTADYTETVKKQSEPRQLDLFSFEQLQAENERLQAQIAQMQPQQSAERFAREECRPAPAHRQQPQAVAATVEPENDRTWLKTAGYIAAASVALLVIWQTGLIIPLGLIGLATSGFLK